MQNFGIILRVNKYTDCKTLLLSAVPNEKKIDSKYQWILIKCFYQPVNLSTCLVKARGNRDSNKKQEYVLAEWNGNTVDLKLTKTYSRQSWKRNYQLEKLYHWREKAKPLSTWWDLFSYAYLKSLKMTFVFLLLIMDAI